MGTTQLGIIRSAKRKENASMSYTTLISTADLAANLSNPDWAVVDCRFALDNPAQGRRAYESAHIPGAVYAHLDEDLSSPIVPGKTGRHPLPLVEKLVGALGRWGIDSSVQVVAYDDKTGGMAAARLWWLLQWLGHENVAVLDGGLARWQAEGRPVTDAAESRPARAFAPHLRAEYTVDAATVLTMLNQPEVVLLDARAPERFRGDVEPIDPVAGHIPGAVSAPFLENIAADGTFLSTDALQRRFRALFNDTPPDQVVCYCGSGVTAAHNVLAIKHAGLGDVRLYSGSWSEWITDPSRPTAAGSS
jgi:thiosulfate/3-mercaptopyruvate sulfurtransferase